VPAGVATAAVTLLDERRYAVPVTVVCPEFDPGQARAWLDAGQIPELARAEHLSLVDIDSGHWPMWTRPVELARILHTVATGQGGA
jgi:pimeloyl-ACP methyl ester carboxylesterase